MIHYLVEISGQELERLKSENARYRKALEKYANPETHSMDEDGEVWYGDYFDYKTAQDALEGKEQVTIFKEALFHFGEGHQVLKAIEELNELSVELARFKMCPDNVIECIDEIADCYVMLAQLKEVFGTEKIDRRIEEKTERLRRLITE